MTVVTSPCTALPVSINIRPSGSIADWRSADLSLVNGGNVETAGRTAVAAGVKYVKPVAMRELIRAFRVVSRLVKLAWLRRSLVLVGDDEVWHRARLHS